MSDPDRYAEDCIICRSGTLGMTEEQIRFLSEVMFQAFQVGAAAGRGFLNDKNIQPTGPEVQAMVDTTSNRWARAYGTPYVVPESDEVRHHAHTKGPQQ